MDERFGVFTGNSCFFSKSYSKRVLSLLADVYDLLIPSIVLLDIIDINQYLVIDLA